MKNQRLDIKNQTDIDQELVQTRLQLQQMTDERDAIRYELDEWRRTFRPAGEEPDQQFIMRIWLRCLGDKCAPKSHLIDGLAITTRNLARKGGLLLDGGKN
jgi:hypothetical protein